MDNKVVVIGSYNTDMIIRTSRIPQRGETIIGGQFSTVSGGKGANQAVAAARAGAKVWFIGRVGKDAFGVDARKHLLRNGINIDYIIEDEHAPTGVASIIVDDAGENSIVVASGANANLCFDDVRAAETVIAGADVMLLQLETPLDTVESAIRIAASHGVKVILNPAPANDIPDAWFSDISIITPNEVEAEMLTGVKIDSEERIVETAEIMLAKGPDAVIITLGNKGVYYCDAFKRLRLAAYEVPAVDSTGAGDVFNGALAACYSANVPIDETLRLASAAAAISVTKAGAQDAAPFLMEIHDFLKNSGKGGDRR